MNELDGYDIEDLKIGMSAFFAKTITEADIVLFAAASGDNNAVHINEEFAQTTQFKGRIAHGMLSASVISEAIAGRLPESANELCSCGIVCTFKHREPQHVHDHDRPP